MKECSKHVDKFGNYRKTAFTLAEVLITLGIIGVVAAMTMPALISKHAKNVTVSQLKKVYSVFSQALMQSEQENGSSVDWVTGGAELNEAAANEYFNKFWKPYLKVNKICKTYKECGYKVLKPWKHLDGQLYDMSVADPASRNSFLLTDGTFVMFHYLAWDRTDPDNPKPIFRQGEGSQAMIVDINGPKNPNVFGKDLFYFTIELNNHRIMPISYDKDEAELLQTCPSAGKTCLTLIMQDGWNIPDNYPW